MSGFKRIVSAISKDLEERLPRQRATQRRKLSELVAGMLVCQTPNLMELSNVLDRPTESAEARYNYVERFLKNPLVDIQVVMSAFAEDLLKRLMVHQHTLVLMIDQSKVNDTLDVLMVSVRLRKRAVPLFWLVKETKGGIGFNEQKTLLETVLKWLPEGCRPMLAGDRFYVVKWDWVTPTSLDGYFSVLLLRSSEKDLLKSIRMDLLHSRSFYGVL